MGAGLSSAQVGGCDKASIVFSSVSSAPACSFLHSFLKDLCSPEDKCGFMFDTGI